jgi:hypothetical protein
MAIGKNRPMTETEKKAKLSVLKDAHKQASGMLKDNLSKYKDSKELKSHTKQMSSDMKHDMKDDSDRIVDPGHDGDVVGRHISDENIDHDETDSVYDIDELDARIKMLLEQKAKIKR